MFKDFLLTQIKRLDKYEYNIFIKYVISYHREFLKRKDVRPNEIEKAVKKLINEETRSIYFEYLDSYIYALEKINERNKKLGNRTLNWKSKTWKELINNVTTGVSLPIDIDLTMNSIDDEDAKIIKNIFRNIIIICATIEEKDGLKGNFKTVEQFFNLFFKETLDK